MSDWPTQQDYDVAVAVEALRGPAVKKFTLRKYSAAEAKSKNAIYLNGRPYSDRGAFAVVYQLTDGSGRSAVFRVFTGSGSSIADLQRRYSEIAQFMKQGAHDWLVEVEWLAEGLKIGAKWQPAVLMERVDGVDLERWLQDNKANKAKMASVADQILRLAKELEEKKIAHGDLSHRNLMVTKSDQVKLVDYDGMYLPSLKSIVPKENGLPGMQHPLRRGDSYGPTMDRFSVLVLYATLLHIKESPNSLPKQCDDGLILLKKHFLDPVGSPLETMLRSSDPELRKVANAIIESSKKPFADTPTLENVLAGPSVAARSIPNPSTATAQVPDYLKQGIVVPGRQNKSPGHQKPASSGSIEAPTPPPLAPTSQVGSIGSNPPTATLQATSGDSAPWTSEHTWGCIIILVLLGGIGWGGYAGYQKWANRTPDWKLTRQLWQANTTHQWSDGSARQLDIQLDLRDPYTAYYTLREIVPLTGGQTAVLLMRSTAPYRFDHKKLEVDLGKFTMSKISIGGGPFKGVTVADPEWVQKLPDSKRILEISFVPKFYDISNIDARNLEIFDELSLETLYFHSVSSDDSFVTKGNVNYDKALRM